MKYNVLFAKKQKTERFQNLDFSINGEVANERKVNGHQYSFFAQEEYCEKITDTFRDAILIRCGKNDIPIEEVIKRHKEIEQRKVDKANGVISEDKKRRIRINNTPLVELNPQERHEKMLKFPWYAKKQKERKRRRRVKNPLDFENYDALH